MTRVLVAEDDALVRAGLVTVLEADPGIEVVGQVGDGEAAVAGARELGPDVVLTDIRMPRLDGLAATERILAWPHPPAVVVLTTFGEQAYVDRAVRAGVSGFLLKTADPLDLVGAVRAAAAGGACLDPGVAADLLAELRGARAAGSAVDALTGRERQVLRLIVGGRSNAEIAVALGLTEGTVKGYVSDVLAKLAVRNRVEAAIVGYRAGGG